MFLDRLRALTAAKEPWFRSLAGEFEFVGRISDRHFRVAPVVRGRNTYVPLVIGTITENGKATEITVTQTLHPVAVAILILFFGGFAVLVLSHGDPASLFAVAAFFVLFHVGMYFIGFIPEARRVEQRLQQLAG